MEATIWGTRGSQASPGPETVRYGGNTSCLSVHDGDQLLVLDAGTGIRRLGATLAGAARVDVLLSHLHMDHIQGLGFFGPLYDPECEVHLWGPSSITLDLRGRLNRYLSPPLFPVRLRDLPCRLSVHDVPLERFTVSGFTVTAALVCHPGPTVGYRIEAGGGVLTYLPDHEPALGARAFPRTPEWTSGHDLAAGADVLVHDCQYTGAEYAGKVGWGHSALPHALAFAALTGVRRLVAFHHDPAHDDDTLDAMYAAAPEGAPFDLVAAREGLTVSVGR